MAITPFTTPVQAPIIDTYVPIPFEDLARAGAAKQARYEEGLANEEAFQLQLDQLSGKGEIYEPFSGSRVELPDSKVIEQIQSDYRAKIDELASNITDKSSPEFRSKIRALLGAYRRDAGPSGRIGIAQQNAATIQEFYKRMQDNPQLQANPHLYAPFIDKIRKHGEATSDGQIRRLDLSGSIGEGVDINKKLTDFLKNYGSRFIGSRIDQYDSVPGLMLAIQEEGADPAEIAQAAVGFLGTDPESRRDLQLQAQFETQQGRPTTVADLAVRYATNMGNVFARHDVSQKQFFDQAAVDRAKKANKRKSELMSTLSRQVVAFQPGTGIKDVSELVESHKVADANIKAAQDNFLLAANKLGLPVDEQGRVTDWVKTYADGSKRDFSTVLQAEMDAVTSAIDKQQALREFEEEANVQAGLTRNLTSSPEYLAAKEEAVGKAMEHLAAMKQSNLYEPAFGGVRSTPEILRQEAEAGEFERYMPKMYNNMYKKRDEYLKEKSEDGTFVAGVTGVTEGVREELEEYFLTDYSNPDLFPDSVKELMTGEELTGFGDLKIFGDGDISVNRKEAKPDFVGYYFDDAEAGKLKLVYNLKNDKGEVLNRVKINAPQNFETMLIEAGDIGKAEVLINRRILGETKALGPLRPKQVLTISPSPNALFSQSGEEGSLPITVIDKGSLATDRYAVEAGIPGTTKVETFATKHEMISYISSVATEFKKKQKEEK